MSTTTKSKPRIVRGVAKRHEVATAGGAVSQWWTPADYAQAFVRWLGIRPGQRVLDLGAGTGSLSLAAIGAGAIVTAVEVDPFHERKLCWNVGARAHVIIGDAFDSHLLDRVPTTHRRASGLPFDVVILNPPWESDQEVRFALRALELAPRAGAIISLDGLVGSGRDETGWKRMRVVREMLSPRRLSFSLDGAGGQEWPVAVEVMTRLAPRRLGAEESVQRSWYEPPARAGR